MTGHSVLKTAAPWRGAGPKEGEEANSPPATARAHGGSRVDVALPRLVSLGSAYDEPLADLLPWVHPTGSWNPGPSNRAVE